MEKDNLDDLMRQKFDTDDPGARFEFREEYWEQAQALIEADERRRKRRFLWWWFFVGLLLAGGGGLFWYGGRHSDHSKDAVQVTAPARQNNEANNGGNRDTYATSSELNNKANEQKNTNTPADRQNDRPIPTESEALSGGNSKRGNSPANEWPADKQAIDTKTTTPKSSRITDVSVNRLNNSGTKTAGQHPSSHHPDAAFGTANVGSKTRHATTAPSSNQPAGNADIPAKMTSDQPPPSTASSTDAAVKEGLPSNLRRDTLQSSVVTPPVNYLLDPLPSIDYQTYAFLPRLLFFPRAAAPEREIKPEKTSRFKVDVYGAATYYNTREETPWFGGTAGASAEYRFYQQFRVFAGAAWRYIPTERLEGIDTISDYFSRQLRYSFGYVQDFYIIRPLALHALEFPIGLRWRWNSIAVEAGIAPSRLIAVRANLLSAHESSFEPVDYLNPNIKVKKIWVDPQTEFYRQAWITSFVGVEWGTGQLKLSVRGFRMPADVLPEQHFLPLPRSKYLYGAEAGLRWRFSD